MSEELNFIQRIQRLNRYIDKAGNGRKLYCCLVTAAEMAFFKMSATNLFLYDAFSKNFFERRTYLSHRDKKKLEALNAKDVSVLQSKNSFDDYFSEFLNRDYLYVPHATFEEFSSFVERHSTFMEKANWACEGIGIHKVTVNPGDDLNALYEKYRKDYILLEEVLLQHPAMSALNASSVNTVRIATLHDGKKAHVIAAALRMGAGGDTDNLHGGGVCCSVDTETGITQSMGINGNQDKFLTHPLTGHIIPGFQIPNWDQVIATAIRAAEKVPQFRWIGWDVAVTENGVAIIEGNHNQGLDLIQAGRKGLRPDVEAIIGKF